MKRTPFHHIHKTLGAKLIGFAGFEMPVQYPTGIVQEHLAVRNGVGVFDVSHMGEFEVSGTDAAAFLNRMTINDVSKLSVGRVQYSAMCYEDGGIVDDLLVYRLEDRFMTVVNASNLQKDFDWLHSHLKGDVRLLDKSEATALLAVQGPQSAQVLTGLTDVDLGDMRYYSWKRGTIAGVPMVISRTGYTGEMGYELYFEANVETATKVWNSIFDAGKPFGIVPVGLGARDTLRLEMGFCLYGNDIDQTTNPLEAGLGWITKLDKTEFVGREVLLEVKAGGLQRRLVGFVTGDKAVPRHRYRLMAGGRDTGVVTSGTFSPSLQHGIGMGYVASANAVVGNELAVDVRGKAVPAKVVKLPFLQKTAT